jgi:hypothetical protein
MIYDWPFFTGPIWTVSYQPPAPYQPFPQIQSLPQIGRTIKAIEYHENGTIKRIEYEP